MNNRPEPSHEQALAQFKAATLESLVNERDVARSMLVELKRHIQTLTKKIAVMENTKS